MVKWKTLILPSESLPLLNRLRTTTPLLCPPARDPTMRRISQPGLGHCQCPMPKCQWDTRVPKLLSPQIKGAAAALRTKNYNAPSRHGSRARFWRLWSLISTPSEGDLLHENYRRPQWGKNGMHHFQYQPWIEEKETVCNCSSLRRKHAVRIPTRRRNACSTCGDHGTKFLAQRWQSLWKALCVLWPVIYGYIGPCSSLHLCLEMPRPSSCIFASVSRETCVAFSIGHHRSLHCRKLILCRRSS